MQMVLTYEPNMKTLKVNKSEIYRYLGYTKQELMGDEVDDLVEEVLQCVIANSRPKVCYKRFPIVLGEGVDFGFMKIDSKDLAYNLEDCYEVIVFAATIGLYTDTEIRKATILSPVRACILQAVGAAVIEAVCGEFNQWVNSSEMDKGNTIKPRYSPGYGDVSLEVQKDIFRELDCAKNAGISLSDSLHMIPEKSVTAFIGIAKKGNSK